jgi:hypothetical protein
MIGPPLERLKLRDCRVVDVRPLERSDRRLLEAAIRRLSDDSRYLRFASLGPRVTERELDHLVVVDHHAQEALLAIDPLTGRGVAVVRLVECSPMSGQGSRAPTVPGGVRCSQLMRCGLVWACYVWSRLGAPPSRWRRRRRDAWSGSAGAGWER